MIFSFSALNIWILIIQFFEIKRFVFRRILIVVEKKNQFFFDKFFVLFIDDVRFTWTIVFIFTISINIISKDIFKRTINKTNFFFDLFANLTRFRRWFVKIILRITNEIAIVVYRRLTTCFDIDKLNSMIWKNNSNQNDIANNNLIDCNRNVFLFEIFVYRNFVYCFEFFDCQHCWKKKFVDHDRNVSLCRIKFLFYYSIDQKKIVLTSSLSIQKCHVEIFNSCYFTSSCFDWKRNQIEQFWNDD